MPSSPVIFLSSGFLGPNRDGNQSITNTIIGFLESGYRVFHFSFVSERDSSFDFRRLKAFVNYHHFGFPGWVLAFFRRLNRLSIRNRPCRPVPADSESVDPGLTEITWKQNAAIVACTLAEFCRMAFASLIVRPGLFYGYEVSGIFAAYGLARLTSKKCVTRFQGTYVTERNMHLPVMALHVAALRLKAHGLVINNDGTRGDVIAQDSGSRRSGCFSGQMVLTTGYLNTVRTRKTIESACARLLIHRQVNSLPVFSPAFIRTSELTSHYISWNGF